MCKRAFPKIANQRIVSALKTHNLTFYKTTANKKDHNEKMTTKVVPRRQHYTDIAQKVIHF